MVRKSWLNSQVQRDDARPVDADVSGDAGLPEPLRRAAEALATDVPELRPEWVAAVVHAATAAVPDMTRDSRAEYRTRWMIGIAAGLFCGLLGAGTTWAVLRRGALQQPASAGPIAVTASVESASRHAADSATPSVQFTLVAPGAAQVSLVGDFNRWDPQTLPMRLLKDGSTWEVQVMLPPGRYAYAFVVDGRLARDPSAAESGTDDFGVPNSVLAVERSSSAMSR